jgi:hypothetical protein
MTMTEDKIRRIIHSVVGMKIILIGKHSVRFYVVEEPTTTELVQLRAEFTLSGLDYAEMKVTPSGDGKVFEVSIIRP